MKLVRDAIAAGIFNDLGSGSNIDLCVITKDKVEFLRPYDEANLKGERYVFNPLPPGKFSCFFVVCTFFSKSNFVKIEREIISTAILLLLIQERLL